MLDTHFGRFCFMFENKIRYALLVWIVFEKIYFRALREYTSVVQTIPKFHLIFSCGNLRKLFAFTKFTHQEIR